MFPDCTFQAITFNSYSISLYTTDTEAQLHNRAVNAPLLRYVDSIRTHGHRAAKIDPLDIVHREEVVAAQMGVSIAVARVDARGLDRDVPA